MLWATGAWELIEPATPEQKQLVNVVEEMAIASGLPKPKIWVVPGRGPQRLRHRPGCRHRQHRGHRRPAGQLSRDELQAVIAHEMAHIQNLDVRLMTLLAGMVGAIALMSDGMGRMLGGAAGLPGGARRGASG